MSGQAKVTLLTKKLRKVFKAENKDGYKIAVDQLSLSVEEGEVFGLLGVNGAGKTTTFKMLAGEIVSTSGQCFLLGMNIRDNLHEIRENIGYCPQFDALIENLTVREQIELFYDLKSLDPEQKEKAVDQMISQMDLSIYEQKLSGSLSGGNKRKLSAAMAIIGNPRLVFMDEPSTGMDPKARRFMWKVISRISTLKKYSTVILTTHSMEEAQALSTRIGIMVRGQFHCIGTPQHIKSKFGKGYEIEIKLSSQFDSASSKISVEDKSERLKQAIALLVQWVEKNIGTTEVLEHFDTFIRLKVIGKISLGQMFGLFEANRSKFNINQYSIKQATVEQIFNKIAEEN